MATKTDSKRFVNIKDEILKDHAIQFNKIINPNANEKF